MRGTDKWQVEMIAGAVRGVEDAGTTECGAVERLMPRRGRGRGGGSGVYKGELRPEEFKPKPIHGINEASVGVARAERAALLATRMM